VRPLGCGKGSHRDTTLPIRMPGTDGLELVRRVTTAPQLSVKVIIITTFHDDEYVARALRDGASGFLLKTTAPGLLVEAIRAALAGTTLISPEVTVRLLARLTTDRATRQPRAAAHHTGTRRRAVARARDEQRADRRRAVHLVRNRQDTRHSPVHKIRRTQLGRNRRMGMGVRPRSPLRHRRGLDPTARDCTATSGAVPAVVPAVAASFITCRRCDRAGDTTCFAWGVAL
jgi:FixJ family two-component response regulator